MDGWNLSTTNMNKIDPGQLGGLLALQLFVYLESWRLVNLFGTTRLTRLLKDTRSSASFHISHNLSLPITSCRSIAVLLSFLMISPLTLTCSILLAMVHFALTTRPHWTNVDKAETAFLWQLCCDITNDFVHHYVKVFCFYIIMHFLIPIDIFMIPSPPCFSRSNAASRIPWPAGQTWPADVTQLARVDMLSALIFLLIVH